MAVNHFSFLNLLRSANHAIFVISNNYLRRVLPKILNITNPCSQSHSFSAVLVIFKITYAEYVEKFILLQRQTAKTSANSAGVY